MAAVASQKMPEPSLSPSPSLMDRTPSRRVPDADSPPTASPERASGSLDHSPSSSSFSSRQLDLQDQSSLRSKEYQKLFGLPADEVHIQDFNCALQENMLLQGHMYLFSNYICFYANFLSFETKKIIPFHEVTCVRRAKVAGIFPTAIEIFTEEKKFFFASFLSREEAFKLINDGWSKNCNRGKSITDQQEVQDGLDSQDCCQENGRAMLEEVESSRQLAYESDLGKRNIGGGTSEDLKLADIVESGVLPPTGELQDNVKEDVEIVQSMTCSSSEMSLAWEEEDSDAPEVPACYTLVAESKFTIKVEEFFQLFFSDDAFDFEDSFHRKCGDKDFKCTEWNPDEKFGHTRTVSFQHPIKLYLGAKFGGCQEVQKYKVYRNSHLVVDTSQEIIGVPYGDYFRVEVLWHAKRDDESETCALRVYINVNFSKKTMFKGKIEQSTIDECRDAYAIWIDTAHQLLKQKKEHGASSLVQDNQVSLHKEERTVGRVEKLNEVNGVRAPASSKDVSEHVVDASGGSGSDSGTYFSSDFLVKCWTAMKIQSPAPLILVLGIALILLLMQISMLTLLSRPQQIHVIPQGDWIYGVNRGAKERGGDLALLDSQIKHLKEELHIFDAQLGWMQREQASLKSRLNDLEVLRKQQK